MFARSVCSLNCTCQASLALDLTAQAKAGLSAFGAPVDELCGADLTHLAAALEHVAQSGDDLVIGCRLKEGFFREVLSNAGIDLAPRFVDVHAAVMWSDEADLAGPKLAAAHAAAAIEPSDVTTVSYESQGVTLILGADDAALELARALQGRMDVTVLLQPASLVLPRSTDSFAIAQGRVRQAQGWLGGFTLVVDDYALAQIAPRGGMGFGDGRDGAVSNCDIIIDLTRGQPLFDADLRPGYLRDDPRRPGAISDLALKAGDLIGSFDKERFVSVISDLCAHSRNQISGCSNCLDLCPTGAITGGGDYVSVDPMVCAGCGECAAACPSGAIRYQVPPLATQADQLRAMITTYHAAGASRQPVILFTDPRHGRAQIEMLARLGRGLPAHVMAFELNEIHSLGPDLIAAALVWGADVVVLTPARPKHGLAGLETSIKLIADIIAPMGWGGDRVSLLATDDPDQLGDHLWQKPRALGARPISQLIAPHDKRGLLVAALSELARMAPESPRDVALAKGAPFGEVRVDADACTLCMACAGACPAGALIDNPETPMLRFSESACLQCGICEATCPEQAISLHPRVDFAMWEQPRRILHQEEPFCCSDCGTGFGTRSGIERVIEKLSGHWMFSGSRAETGLKMLTLCEDCRVKGAAAAGFDAHHDAPSA